MLSARWFQIGKLARVAYKPPSLKELRASGELWKARTAKYAVADNEEVALVANSSWRRRADVCNFEDPLFLAVVVNDRVDARIQLNMAGQPKSVGISVQISLNLSPL
jgi:hypothetical protein